MLTPPRRCDKTRVRAASEIWVADESCIQDDFPCNFTFSCFDFRAGCQNESIRTDAAPRITAEAGSPRALFQLAGAAPSSVQS